MRLVRSAESCANHQGNDFKPGRFGALSFGYGPDCILTKSQVTIFFPDDLLLLLALPIRTTQVAELDALRIWD
jgi:hypothetical protein